MKPNYLLIVALSLFMIAGLSSCKSKKKVSAKSEIGDIIEELPCENKGQSDKNYFRASAMSTSADLSLAKEKALLQAKQRLVTLINSNTKSVTDRYVNEREIGDASEFEQKFENMTREVADETINNIVVICEKASVMDNGKYHGFVAIEVHRDDVLKGIDDRISNNDRLQLDYDKKKFQEIFEEEMEEMAEERGY
ncbi:hypothetical protein [Marinilabilia rubra]|uniref:LPP20 lipoprotein n=1 Tax=Marinilabilia rubra TaxID=2162893 RepID=A0A2U2B894_9BACT|nr:hypothetical protein [Marinilabilia rubra]PWD99266.1 hypothetical protein DDZ16_11775 [Marinilabilia rubra]